MVLGGGAPGAQTLGMTASRRPFLSALAALAAGLLPAQQDPVAAAKLVPAAELCGRVETHGSLTLLRTWGTADQRGYAHGRLLAVQVVEVLRGELQARFARKRPVLQQARATLGRNIAWPDEVRAEIAALFRGLVDAGVDLAMPELDRDIDEKDLLLANALDVYGLLGCSGFTLWGDQVEGGGVLTGRNFDWPFTGAHMVDRTMLLVQHLPDGNATASVTWPGYVAIVTGVNRDGITAFLHVGNAEIRFMPEPESWASAVAVRAVLEQSRAKGGTACFDLARELLEQTSPPIGYITRVTLPAVPADGPPAAVFEADHDDVVAAPVVSGAVVTNHFLGREDGRPAPKDSIDRHKRIVGVIEQCLGADDHAVSVAEAWDALVAVQRGGGHAFGTLHSLVFRAEPWHFELRVGLHTPKGLVAAPSADRVHVLTRDQLFPATVPATL